MEVIFLEDGYNGDIVICNAEPIEYDGKLVKLQVVEKGKEYLTRWVHCGELPGLK